MLDKGFKTVLLYLLLAVKPQKLFNLKLHRQTVGIPPRLSRNHIALHGAVARNHILYNTGKHMTYMRLTVSGGRAVIEYIGLITLALGYALFKYIFVFPKFFNLFFFLHEVEVRGYALVHCFFLLSK